MCQVIHNDIYQISFPLQALRLSQGVYSSVETRHVVNLISTDTQIFDRV